MTKSIKTQLTNTFVFGSGLNLDTVRVKAQQPKEMHPITDGQIEVFKGKGKTSGLPFEKVTISGFDAITGQAVRYELPQRYATQSDMEFCVVIDPWVKFSRDEEGNKIGEGYQHAKGIRECSKEDLMQYCIKWANGRNTQAEPII